MNTDTPRTDAYNNSLGVVPAKFARELERELAISLENQVKTQADLERLKEDKMRLTVYCADLLDMITPSL